MNAARRKLQEGKLVLCMGLRLARTLDAPMVAAAAGFDAVYIDLEHSPISLETASTLCIGSAALGLTPLVRVPGHGEEWVARALDGGAQGVIVPGVSSRAEAEQAVAAARFPPAGRRSVMGATPALGYRPVPLAQVNETLNRETLVIPMIETAEGVAAAREIASVAGVDLLLVGANDLSTALGVPGELRHAKMKSAVQAVAAACRQAGKPLGMGGIRSDAELQRELVDLGARLFLAGTDVGYLASAARQDADALRRLEPGRGG
jgi:2-keto-3-deoxy-L-rhamnonate aldolase RhmA